MYHILVGLATWAEKEATPHVSPEYRAALLALARAVRDVIKFH
jgi:hypothetical protein